MIRGKQLIHKTIMRTITKYSNEEAARRGEKNFGSNPQELKVFIASKYASAILQQICSHTESV